jgi:TonB-linked SusC/RagA family outer membrane protein
MRKLLSSLSFVLLWATIALAQERAVTGTVTASDDGSALPGVSIKVRGATTGTQTGADGQYSITIPDNNAVLVFSFIGFATQEVTVGGRNVVNLAMSTDAQQLGEVVVTGYGTQRRTEFTGAVATVTGASIQDRPIQSFDQALTGRASGVNIVQPNGLLNNPPVIRIRGVNSISLSSFPLVIVDGIPISTDQDISVNTAAVNNPLGDINPADIETIDILKDAASTSIYGSRAANGVLVITTKKGKKGVTKVSYSGWAGVNNAVRLPDLLNAQQFIDHKNKALANALALNPNAVNASQRDAQGRGFFANLNPDGSMVDTKWTDEIYRTAFSQNHSLTMSGGTEKTTFYFSGGYTDQDGFLKNNSFQRSSGRFNIGHDATSWLKLSANVNYNNTINNSPPSGSNPGSAFTSGGLGRLALAQAPNLAPYTADGAISVQPGTQYIGRGNNKVPITWYNPIAVRDLDNNTSENNRLIANLVSNIRIIEGLNFKTSYSWDRGNTENVVFWNPVSGDGWGFNGLADNNTFRRNNWNLINTLQYQKTFAEKHNVNVLVGTDVQKTRVTQWGAQRQNLSDPFFTNFQGNYTITQSGDNGIGLRAYESYLSSLNYNYAGKYFISGNFRRDGNSALSPENRWGNFGGASLGWTLSEENFFKSSALGDKISNVRLKASWGRVGNGNLPSDYGSYTTFAGELYGDEPALAFNQAGNKDLRWETSTQTNLGIDIGILNNAVSFEVNYYTNNIDNLILEAPQAPSKGIPNNTILTNVGSMVNNGFEFSVNATPVRRSQFSWSTNLNLTTNRNEVTALTNDGAPIIGTTGSLERTSITAVGSPVGSIYAVKTAGVNPENGRRIFINAKGQSVQYLHHGGTQRWTFLDGTVAPTVSGADAQIVGSALPTWYGGFNNNFKYRNLDANILFTFSGGNKIYNGTQAGLRDQRHWNNSVEVLDAWSSPGQNAQIPRPVYGDNISNGSAFANDSNVQSGDFLRLQSATIGYTIAPRLFGRTGINSLRIYTQINNAFLVTKYKGVDPEISTNGNDNIAPGVERNSIPQGRAMTFGLSLGL